MFTQLRNKFLMLNLVIISVMMLIAFSSIYLITYNRAQSEIDMELHKLLDFSRRGPELSDSFRGDFDRSSLAPIFEPDSQRPERSVFFGLIVDHQWAPIIISPLHYNEQSEFYESALQAARFKNTDKGKVKLDGYYWAFRIVPYGTGYKLVFLNITSRQGILTNLIYTFLLVALIMFVIIFFVSKFFANRSIQPIQEAFEKQKLFIADASHELKTPLSVIHTNVDVLLSNGEDRIQDQSKWLYYIKSEADRMTRLTNDLLYLTQVDYSDHQMIFSDFDMSEVVEQVILTMEAVVYENHITLEYNIEPPIMVHGSSEQIQQMIMILLDNGIKYTNQSGFIHIELKKNHNTITFSISNTGEGIPEEHMDKIFDRFYRTDKSRTRQSGGYGLGLSIAKAIVEQHKGKISVKSTLHKSTTFTIELPRQTIDKPYGNLTNTS